MTPRIFLSNIGANSSHRYFSPLFPDGTFELLPIPDTPQDAGPHSVKLADVPLKNPANGRATDWIPERLHGVAAHHDPEFDTLTYGDNCERGARAVALKKAVPGDLILFLARLQPHDGTATQGEAAFFLIGMLEIESILPSVYDRPSGEQLARFGANAHVRKGLNDPANWDGFWVFAGTPRSSRFERAVPFDRALCDAVMRTAAGKPWHWDGQRSELQVIGSYTRTCRVILSPEQPDYESRAAGLYARIEMYNPGVMRQTLRQKRGTKCRANQKY